MLRSVAAAAVVTVVSASALAASSSPGGPASPVALRVAGSPAASQAPTGTPPSAAAAGGSTAPATESPVPGGSAAAQPGRTAAAVAAAASASTSGVLPPRTLARSSGSAVTVAEYHDGPSRTGVFPGVPAPGSLAVGWNAALDGAIYAQPLFVGGLVIAATENDSLYGLDPATGAVRWRTSVGTPQQASALPCGNISPTVGITGTPAYDPVSGLVFAVAEEATAQSATPQHELVGVDPASGAVRLRQSVDLGVSGTSTNAMQERSALTVANGRVYVTFGGRAGDCGAYRGQVIGVPTSGGTPVSYTVPTTREAGMWNPSGPTVDASGDVYVAVGNGAAGAGDAYDHSDSVLKLSPTLQLLDFYAPSDWASQNDADQDLGSTGPTLMPNGLVLAIGKSPAVYVTRQSSLGGIGGQLTRTNICTGFGGTAQSGTTPPVVYLPCTDGTRAVSIAADGTPTVLWHADSSLAGAPSVGGGAVWVLDTGGRRLLAVSQSTGATLGSVTIASSISRFAAVALVGGEAFVPTTTGVTAVTGA